MEKEKRKDGGIALLKDCLKIKGITLDLDVTHEVSKPWVPVVSQIKNLRSMGKMAVLRTKAGLNNEMSFHNT